MAADHVSFTEVLLFDEIEGGGCGGRSLSEKAESVGEGARPSNCQGGRFVTR